MDRADKNIGWKQATVGAEGLDFEATFVYYGHIEEAGHRIGSFLGESAILPSCAGQETNQVKTNAELFHLDINPSEQVPIVDVFDVPPARVIAGLNRAVVRLHTVRYNLR